MNLEQLQQKLIATARANPPGEHVPYAFEKRIMARIAATTATDVWALWSRVLWRAAAPCVALALLLGVFHFVTPGGESGTATIAGIEDLSQHFEQTLLAGVNESEEVW